MKRKNIIMLALFLICSNAFSMDTLSLSDSLAEDTEVEAKIEELAFSMKMDRTVEGVGNLSEGLSDLEGTINDSYTSKDLIKYALDNRLDYSLGDRVRFLDQKAQEIVERSEQNEDEKFMRMTLNRTREMARLTIEIMGKSHQESVRFLSNFYKEGFELAYSVVNNNSFVHDRSMESFFDEGEFLTSAEYGRMMAIRMWNYSTGLQSDASKGVFLVKLVQYLGADMASDLRVREPAIAKSLADVVQIKKSAAYKAVLRSLSSNKIPGSEEMAGLRKEIWRLVRNMNTRF